MNIEKRVEKYNEKLKNSHIAVSRNGKRFNVVFMIGTNFQMESVGDCTKKQLKNLMYFLEDS